MAALGKIDEIVDAKAFAQVEKLTDTLNTSNQAILNNINNVLQLNAALGNSKSLPALTKEIERQQLSLQKLAQAQNRTAVTATQLEKANLSLSNAQKRQAEQQDRSTKRATEATREFTKLEAELKRLDKAAQDTGIAFGANSEQYKKAAAEANEVRARLQSINQPLGNFKDQVGQYTNGIVTAFSKGFNGLRILANIIPGLGISGIFLVAFEGITGLLSKFDLFTDKLNASREILKSLNQVNKEASTEYGKQSSELRILYTAATDVNNSLEARLRAARQLQQDFPTTFKNYTAEKIITGELKGNYDELTKSLLDSAKARAAASKIAELSGKVQENEFQKIKIATALQNELRKARQGRASNEETNKELENAKVAFDVTEVISATTATAQRGLVDQAENSSKARARIAAREIDANNKVLQAQIDFLTKYAGGNNKIADALSQGSKNSPDSTLQKDQLAAINALIQAEKTRNQIVQSDETKSFDERLKSADDFVRKTTEYINRRKDIELGAENLTAEGRKAIVQRVNNDIQALALERLKELQKLQDEETADLQKQYQTQTQLSQDADKATVASLEKATQEKLQLNAQLRTDSLVQLAEQYRDGLINAQQYADAVLVVEEESAKESLQIQLNQLDTLISARREAGLDTAKLEAESAAIQAKIDTDLTRKRIKNIEDEARLRERARKELLKAEKEVADALINLAQNIVNAGFQRQQDEIKNQEDAINKKAEADKKDVDRSLLTSEQKADAEALIDAQSQSQKETLSQRSKDLQNQQAKADRAFTIAKIIETTAIAVISALAPPPVGLGPVFGVPVAVAAGAAGAIQLATVLSTPLPQYYKGTDNAPGGLAWVGERGSELIVDPQGRTTLSPNGATLSYLQPGTQVYTHEKTMQMLSKPEKLSPAQSGGMSWDAFAKLYKNGNEDLKRSLSKKPVNYRLGKKGVTAFQQENNSRTEYKNRYLR